MAADLSRVPIWHVSWLFRGLLLWLCVVDLVVDVECELLLVLIFQGVRCITRFLCRSRIFGV